MSDRLRRIPLPRFEKNVKRDGQWHKIKVRVSAPKGFSNLKVKRKEGYYAVANKGEW